MPVGGPGGLEFLIAFLGLVLQLDDLLLQLGDPTLQLINVGRGAQARLSPDLLPEQLGQFLLQLPDAGGLSGDLALRVGQVRQEGGPADHRSVAVRGRRVDLGGVDLAEQVVVAVEKRCGRRRPRGRWPTR